MRDTRTITAIPLPSRLILAAGLLLAMAAALPARAGEPAAPPGVPAAVANPQVSVFEIMADEAEALTFSAKDKHLWIYGKQRLQAFRPDGQTVLDRRFPQLPATHHAVDMLVGNDTVWLAIGNELYRFNLQGQLTAERRFRDRIHAIHYDAKKSQVMVTTPRHVIVLDTQGRQVDKIRTRLPHVA